MIITNGHNKSPATPLGQIASDSIEADAFPICRSRSPAHTRHSSEINLR